MIPIDFRYPPKLLYIEKAQNGNYYKNIDEISSTIKEVLKKMVFAHGFTLQMEIDIFRQIMNYSLKNMLKEKQLISWYTLPVFTNS